MFTDSSSDGSVLEFTALGFPPPEHPAEPDLFCRQAAMPGHDQERLESARFAVVGCGGLGSWIALGLVRMGVRHLRLFDADRFDRTNAPRQLMFAENLGQQKAASLAANLMAHCPNSARVVAFADAFDDAIAARLDADVLVAGVDNNQTRLDAAAWGRARQRPVVFAMLSRDGLRSQVFLQRPGGPCLSCVLPDLDPDSSAPCAAASIASCYLACAHAVHLAAAAVMPANDVPTWRETSLDGSTERALSPARREKCWRCSFVLGA